MALLVRGPVVEEDAGRLDAAIKRIGENYPDHRLRAIALDSPGGLLDEAKRMAGIIYSQGLATAVPEGAECASACVLLFVSGSRKIAAAGAFVGVHGAAVAGIQTKGALAATTELAQAFERYGVPASVIGRMVVTPPDQVAWLTAKEIERMPAGAVMSNLSVGEIPNALFGTFPRPAPPSFVPAPGAKPILLGEPAHTPAPVPLHHSTALIREATDYSAGYAYGNWRGPAANCGKAIGYWLSGCLAGSYDREKDDLMRGGGCLANRDLCRENARLEGANLGELAVDYRHDWLQQYDWAYTHKLSEAECFKRVAPISPPSDGCRVGASAWLRAEPQ